MEYKDRAIQLFDNSYNCSQAVLCSCCKQLGLEEPTAYHLSAFFGGGMREGQTCGAVTGALMALGLKYGDENNRQCTKSVEFLQAFHDKFGSTLCHELLSVEGASKKESCPIFVSFAAEYLEQAL